jgi:hypothetical protein
MNRTRAAAAFPRVIGWPVCRFMLRFSDQDWATVKGQKESFG